MIFSLKRVPSSGRKLSKQAGVTLTEVGVGIAISSVIGMAAFYMVPKMLAENNAKRLHDAITVSIPKIQGAHQNRTNFSGLTTAVVARNGWIAEPLISKDASGVPTGTLVAPWDGGTITVATASPFTQGTFTVTGASTAVCNAVVTTMMDNDIFVSANVGTGTPVKASVASGVDFDAAGTRCSAAGTKTLTFTFGRS